MTIQSALAQLDDGLAQVDQQAQLAAILGKVRAHGLVSVDGDAQRKAVAKSFYSLSRCDEQFALRLLYVSICFCYEEFIRNVFRAVVEAHGAVASGQLRDGLKGHNVRSVGSLLTLHGTASAPHVQLGLEQAAQVLQRTVDPEGRGALHSEAMLFQFQSPTCENCARLLDYAGVNLSWQQVGAHEAVRQALGEKNAKSNEAALLATLTKLIRVRNRVVHDGGREIVVSLQEVQQLVTQMSAVGKAIALLVGQRLP